MFYKFNWHQIYSFEIKTTEFTTKPNSMGQILIQVNSSSSNPSQVIQSQPKSIDPITAQPNSIEEILTQQKSIVLI